ncbi:hypothetical protein Q3G72_018177 [Acer saccharum]|nr:hypothetical protein Q3G72_018177 [Acer saccharum]
MEKFYTSLRPFSSSSSPFLKSRLFWKRPTSNSRNEVPPKRADQTSHDKFLNEKCRSGRLEFACKLFHKLAQEGLLPDGPDVITYNIIINGLCKEGQLEDANDLLSNMEEKGFAPNSQQEINMEILLNKCLAAIDGMDMLKMFGIEKGLQLQIVKIFALELHMFCEGPQKHMGLAICAFYNLSRQANRVEKLAETVKCLVI